MQIKDLKNKDFIKLKKGSLIYEVIEVGNDFRNGLDYVIIYNDVTMQKKTLIDVSNYEKA